MKAFKLISYFFLILFLSSSMSAQGFFDKSDNFNYYVNNPTPEVEVYIRIPTDNLVILDASLVYNGENKFLDLVDEIVPSRTAEYVKKIKLSDFPGQGSLKNNDETYFKLNIVKQGTTTPIDTNGNPIEFNIILDVDGPSLISPSSENVHVTSLDQKFNFLFNEKITKFEITNMDGDIIVSEPNEILLYEDEYSDSITFTFNEYELIVGENKFIVTYYDFADNKVDKNINFVFKGEELKIELVTRADDSNLKYYYDPQYSSFLDNKIHFSEDEFELVIKTNNRARCYFSSSFIGFIELKNLLNTADYSEFTTNDNLMHTFSMNSEELIWVACQDINFPDEVKYLNRELGFGDELVKLKKYTSSFEISRFYPQVIVSNVPFSVETHTTQPTICDFTINENDKRDFGNTSTEKIHIKHDVDLSNGNHNIKISCFDKIFNVKTLDKDIQVDTTSGPRVVGDKKFYTDSLSTPISLKFTEDASCVSSPTQIQASEFNSSTSLGGTGLEKTIIPSGLVNGDNDYFIYCASNGQLIMSQIEILYDSNQPLIKGLVFFNNAKASEYITDNKRIKFKVSYEGLIPAKVYEVDIVYSNFSIRDNFTRSSGVVSRDVSNAQKFKIKLINILGKVSNTLEKQIKFDLEAPIVSISKIEQNWKVICIDIKSGCDKIYYGFSQSPISCNANTLYTLDDEIEPKENNFLCARAIDFVGNQAEEQVDLNDGGYGFKVENRTVSDGFDDTNKSIETPLSDVDENNENSDETEPFTQNPDNGQLNTESNGLIIAAAVILLLGTIGGGGYYGYREGYLDTQLEKFGIFRNKPISSNIGNSKIYTPINKNEQDDKKKVVIKKTGYDRNLKKINSFIDSTLNKGNDVFDSFDTTSKGKNKNYEDTLIKGKLSKKNQEFSLKKNQNEVESKSIEKEAEEFESYFKEKEIESKDKKGSNKKD